MKINKDNFGWIFSCVILSIGLILSIIMGITGFYYRNTFSSTTDLKLGEALQVEARGNQANSISVNLDGSFLPGERIRQDLIVKNLELDDEIFLRAKLYIYSTENRVVNLNVDLSPNWKYNLQDGYYYFNGGLSPQGRTLLASNIIIDENDDLVSNKKYIMTLLVEGFSEKEDAERVWKVDFSTFFDEV